MRGIWPTKSGGAVLICVLAAGAVFAFGLVVWAVMACGSPLVIDSGFLRWALVFLIHKIHLVGSLTGFWENMSFGEVKI